MEPIVYIIPDTLDVNILRLMNGNNGGKLNILIDINDNFVISQDQVENPEFSNVRNLVLLQGHVFKPIKYVPKIHPKSPEEL